MQIVSAGDNLHEMSNLFSGNNKRNISVCCLLKILPRELCVEEEYFVIILVSFSLFLHTNIHCGCSLEVPTEA